MNLELAFATRTKLMAAVEATNATLGPMATWMKGAMSFIAMVGRTSARRTVPVE